MAFLNYHFSYFTLCVVIIDLQDYLGQKLSENIHYFLVILFGAISWFYGYYLGDFEKTFYGWSVGLGLSLIITIPDWPFYNRHQVQWLDELPEYSSETKKSIFKKTVKTN